jgi:hypothetical protein
MVNLYEYGYLLRVRLTKLNKYKEKNVDKPPCSLPFFIFIENLLESTNHSLYPRLGGFA